MERTPYEKREDFEEQELEEIGIAIMNGYLHGMTVSGSSWSLDVNFEYPEGCGR